MDGERLRLTTRDGVSLAARWDRPEDGGKAAVVFCHPHPEYGGTKHAPLMNGVADRLVERGYAVLRFDFRGAGDSEGDHGGGVDELADLSAAIDEARSSGQRILLAGWSFGGAVALAWLAAEGEQIPYAGIAPAIGAVPGDRDPSDGPKVIVLGTRDSVVDREAVRQAAEDLGADLVEEPGDHFFLMRTEAVGDRIADFFDEVCGRA